VGCLIVTGAFSLGIGSRLTAVLAWAIAVSTARRSPVLLYGFDQMVSTWTLYLAVSGASGQAVSIDRFVARWREARRALARRPKDGRWPLASGAPAPSVGANIGLRLIQLHLCLIYGMAGLAKLRGDAWWTGYAVWGVLAAGEFRRFNLTWMAGFPLLLNLMTHTGLLFELVYPFLIWVRLIRPILLGFAVILHVGIDLSLGLTEFALAMLAGNLAFVSGRWLRSLVAGRKDQQPSGRVLYDGACPRCRASMALAGAADPDGVLAPVDLTSVDVRSLAPGLTAEGCQRAMHWVGRDGKVKVGYDAVTAVARRLPMFWVPGALGALPGVAWVGRRVYNQLAARREREVPCDDQSCGLPGEQGQGGAPLARTRKEPGRTRQ
jgi:predicted DCC family thiol-disulfide oxidoreductase YuxK